MSAMFAIGTPEAALGVFERIHRLRVTIHDLRGTLQPYIAGDRYCHTQPACQAVKLSGGDGHCVDLEINRLARDLPNLADGRVHVCHAGFVEWIVPVSDGNGVAWVLFAGIRRPGKTLRPAYVDPASAFRKTVALVPAVVEADEAADILEHLRQLAARLKAWASPLSGAGDASRRAVIHRYVETHHRGEATLEDLARNLQMSPSRASHVVRETFGRSFRDLLTDARLHTAMTLLRGTTLPVMQVALRSGFPEVAHFHRMFRERMSTTPRKYRTSPVS